MTDPMLPSDPPSQAPVLTLTLNPALDMATDVPRMVPDEKLRCSDPALIRAAAGSMWRAPFMRWGANRWRWWRWAG